MALLLDTGNNIAASRTTILMHDFPSVQAVLMVGIAGGVPHPTKPDEHVRLGDIVVCNRYGDIQYDFGKEVGDGFTLRNPPRPPSPELLECARHLDAEAFAGRFPWEAFIDVAARGFKPPVVRPTSTDKLADSNDPSKYIRHPKDSRRRPGLPRVFSGAIASSNTLLKNPVKRDQLRHAHGVKAVEMEGSGIADAAWMGQVHYIVVRGICDYWALRRF